MIYVYSILYIIIVRKMHFYIIKLVIYETNITQYLLNTIPFI